MILSLIDNILNLTDLVSPYLNAGAVWGSDLLRRLIDETVDLRADQELASAAISDPMLLVGAVDVLKGVFRTFDSRDGEISTDAILASAAIPNIFRSVRLGRSVYWDGLFSQNPPVHTLLDSEPDEIWERVRTAVTDPQRVRRTDPGRPEVCNVCQLHRSFGDDYDEIWEGERTARTGCVDTKKLLAERILAHYAEARERSDEPDSVSPPGHPMPPGGARAP